MLEGLEISVVKFSEMKNENGELRIDSNFFLKRYLSEKNNLLNKKIPKLGNIAFVTDGQHGYYERDEKSKIHMLAARNCKNFFADLMDAEPLAKWVDDKNKRSSLQEKDIVLSTRGTVGFCAIVLEDVLPANINQDVARIQLLTNDIIPEFLIIYLNCKYGQDWMIKNQTGMVQQGISLDKVRQIPIPIFPDTFQSKIESIVKSAHAKLEESKSLYSQAEDLLLGELGLKDWQPKNTLHTTKKFSDFAQSGRLDAEYYQPKYDEIEKAIKSYKGGYDIVSNLFNQNLDVCDYKKTEYNYVEIGDVNVGDGSVSFNKVDTSELPDNAKRVLHKNDILISKVRPYRGAVAIIDFEQEDLIGSGAFTVLQEKSSYKKETLQILFRTAVYKDWLLKWNVGSSYPVIKDEDILNLPIPILPEQIQTKSASLIQQSFECKAQSKQLLEDAKRMVEEEIEKN